MFSIYHSNALGATCCYQNYHCIKGYWQFGLQEKEIIWREKPHKPKTPSATPMNTFSSCFQKQHISRTSSLHWSRTICLLNTKVSTTTTVILTSLQFMTHLLALSHYSSFTTHWLLECCRYQLLYTAALPTKHW